MILEFAVVWLICGISCCLLAFILEVIFGDFRLEKELLYYILVWILLGPLGTVSIIDSMYRHFKGEDDA